MLSTLSLGNICTKCNYAAGGHEVVRIDVISGQFIVIIQFLLDIQTNLITIESHTNCPEVLVLLLTIFVLLCSV